MKCGLEMRNADVRNALNHVHSTSE